VARRFKLAGNPRIGDCQVSLNDICSYFIMPKGVRDSPNKPGRPAKLGLHQRAFCEGYFAEYLAVRKQGPATNAWFKRLTIMFINAFGWHDPISIDIKPLSLSSEELVKDFDDASTPDEQVVRDKTIVLVGNVRLSLLLKAKA
jgi:hypothetical protein